MTAFRSAAVAALLLGGCAAGGADVVSVLSHGDCQTLEARLSEVDYERLAEIRGTRLIGMTVPETTPEQPSLTLIAVSPGQRPTPGYAVALERSDVDDGVLSLHLTVTEPPEDAVLAQMVTHPCLVVGVPADAYRAVEAVGPDGDRWGRLRLSGPEVDKRL